jgi:hypothetical protein
MNQAATSAFEQVAMQHHLRGVRVESADIPFLEDGYIVNNAREIAQSDLFENNQRLQEQLGTGTECQRADGSKFDLRQVYRINGKKKKGTKLGKRAYNNRLDFDEDSDSYSDDDPEFTAAVAQSRAEAASAPSTHQDQRKKPPVYSQHDGIKSRAHVAPVNLQEPLGISAVATALFGGPVPSYGGAFAPPEENNVARGPARISPPNPAPYVPPPAAAPFVSPPSNNGGRLYAPVPRYQDRRGPLEARVVARSMRTASQRYGDMYNVDEPGEGWQPVDDKDAMRARKRIRHMSENPQIVSMVLDNCTDNVADPDSQEAIVIYDEITDQWDD